MEGGGKKVFYYLNCKNMIETKAGTLWIDSSVSCLFFTFIYLSVAVSST